MEWYYAASMRLKLVLISNVRSMVELHRAGLEELRTVVLSLEERPQAARPLLPDIGAPKAAPSG